MTTLGAKILERARALPEGTPLVARELLHLGSRAAVDQSLSRLAKNGQLLRTGRGLYVRPVETRFGERPPALPKLIEAIAQLKGETLVPSGAAAANSLGLTTQVPVKEVYLTSGPSRQLSMGAQVVELRHAPAWQLVLPASRAGQALRALVWLGKERASEAVPVLRRELSAAEIVELGAVQGRIPTWVGQHVSALVHG